MQRCLGGRCVCNLCEHAGMLEDCYWQYSMATSEHSFTIFKPQILYLLICVQARESKVAVVVEH